jgi:hypothetical protein
MASKYRVTVNLTESEYKELAKLADDSQLSMAWLSRQGIAQLLKQLKSNKHQLSLLDSIPKRKA